LSGNVTMPNKLIFADEAGCLAFNREPNVSKYFLLCTISMNANDLAGDFISLRRQLVWDGFELGDSFHASTDKQAVRDRVFETITQHPFTIQATIMEKSKATPKVRETTQGFYHHTYYHHFKHGVSPSLDQQTKLLVTTASLGTKKERLTFRTAIDDVMEKTAKVQRWQTDFRQAQADPGLQAADYCAWAIQRKWERQDTRSYELIAPRITYESDVWRRSDVHHY
jgi:hypothetical protein